MAEQTRQPWDFGRFFDTLDYFDAVPIVSALRNMFFGSPPPPPPQLQANVVFDFRHPTEQMRDLWGALDDVVMGGVSQSGAQLQTEGLAFTGYVSTANSGGFASVRTRNFEPPLDLSAYSGLELRVRGDGQRYKFFLRDGAGWDAVAYAYSFDTVDGGWVTVQVPFADMKAVQRARVVQRGPINTERIYSLQFMLSKFEYDRQLNPHFTAGAFQLTVESIEAY
ncbi:MAG: CIA30 family protein [Symploca sp. SIO2G7]|nr:CIA30 family protein [Symploca sp. SIO2G7]